MVFFGSLHLWAGGGVVVVKNNSFHAVSYGHGHSSVAYYSPACLAWPSFALCGGLLVALRVAWDLAASTTACASSAWPSAG